MSYILEWLLPIPAILFLGAGLINIIKFNSHQKNSTKKRRLLTTMLGPLALFTETVLDSKSKKLLRNFYISGVFFAIYLFALLLVNAIKI